MTISIDEGLNEMKFIVPGIGDFGDRSVSQSVSTQTGRNHPQPPAQPMPTCSVRPLFLSITMAMPCIQVFRDE